MHILYTDGRDLSSVPEKKREKSIRAVGFSENPREMYICIIASDRRKNNRQNERFVCREKTSGRTADRSTPGYIL